MSGLGVLALGVQFRRPATLLPYRGVLRVGARNRAGPLGSGGRTFSSGTSLASPSVRESFVLRDVRHSKSQICNDLLTERCPTRPLTSGVPATRAGRCPTHCGRREICQNRGWASTSRPHPASSGPLRTARDLVWCSLWSAIADVDEAVEWWPADRPGALWAGVPAQSGSFCQLTVTANSQQKGGFGSFD